MFVSFVGIIDWKYTLKQQITKGMLNDYLVKPKNIFFMWVFTRQNERALLQFLLNLKGIFIISFFIDFKFSFMFFLIYFLIIILYYLIRVFSNSINFFSFGLASFVYGYFLVKFQICLKFIQVDFLKK